MYYLVNVVHKGMAVHYDGLQEMLYIQCSERPWWYVVEWQWRGW